MYYKHLLNLIIQLKLLTFSLYIHCYWGKCSKCPLHVSQLVFKMEGYFHQKIKVVLMDVIGSKCVWKSRCDWPTHSVVSWESHSIFTCEMVWKFSGLNLVWNFSYMKFFIHEIGVNFLSGMFNLVPHVKFLICIHFKHVSGVNQVWNRPDLMRIFCTGLNAAAWIVTKLLSDHLILWLNDMFVSEMIQCYLFNHVQHSNIPTPKKSKNLQNMRHFEYRYFTLMYLTPWLLLWYKKIIYDKIFKPKISSNNLLMRLVSHTFNNNSLLFFLGKTRILILRFSKITSKSFGKFVDVL